MTRLLLIILIFLTGWTGFAQEFETSEVKNLKSSLLHLKGKNKVDVVQQILTAYFNFDFFWGNNKREDSIWKYAHIAVDEARRIHYAAGEANAKVFIGMLKMHKNQTADAEVILKSIIQEKKAGTLMTGFAYGFLGALTAEKYQKYDVAAEYIRHAIHHFKLSGNIKQAGVSTTHLSMVYHWKGDLVAAVEHCTNALIIARRFIQKETHLTGWSDYLYIHTLNLLIGYHQLGGDYSTAKEYLNEIIRYYRNRKKEERNFDHQWSSIYIHEKKYDSAFFFLNRILNTRSNDLSTVSKVGKVYLEQKMYDSALSKFHILVDTFRSRVNKTEYPRARLSLMENLIWGAKAHYHTGRKEKATEWSKEALQTLIKSSNSYSALEVSEMYSTIYQILGDPDSSFYYYERYKTIKDSMVNRQLLFQLTQMKKKAEDDIKTAQLEILQKENELQQEQLLHQFLLRNQKEAELLLIEKDRKLKESQLEQAKHREKEKESELEMISKEQTLKDQKLQQQAFQRNVLATGLLLFFIFSFFIVRAMALNRRNEKLQREKAEDQLKLQQLENEKRHVQFREQKAQLEMQALRAQMNPHFIFNCLSSINWLIIENNSEAASDYLNKFSRLIRMVLVNSEKATITLDEEIKMLQLYLEMEQMRFEKSFNYTIVVDDEIDVSEVAVPPLLLQPFCENAIWHGLMHLPVEKIATGNLQVRINEQNGNLLCTITDNGIGRNKSVQLKKSSGYQHKSLGMKITNDRIRLFNADQNTNIFQIEDVIDSRGNTAGTRVMIKVKKKNIERMNI